MADSGGPIRIMTFNMRLKTEDDAQRCGRDCRWEQRRDLFIDSALKHQPDILGMQEVMPSQYEDIQGPFKEAGYALLYQQRGDAHSEGLCTAIRSPWRAVDSGAFWLAVDTPDVPGSVAVGAKHPRIACWASLEDQAGRSLFFVNTHLEHQPTEVGEGVRVQSSEQIAAFIAEKAGGAPAVLTLDSNAEPGAQAHRNFEASGLVDSWSECHPAEAVDRPFTFHLFEGLKFEVPASFKECWHGCLGPTGIKTVHIDWIFHTPSLRATRCEIDRTVGEDGSTPSDHFAVFVDLLMSGELSTNIAKAS